MHSSCLLTTSNHRHHYQQPRPINYQPSIHKKKGELEQSCFNCNWRAKANESARAAAGCSDVPRRFHTGHLICKMSREKIKGKVFHGGGTRPPRSQHPLLAKAEPKGQAEKKARTTDTMVFFSKSGSPEPTVLSRETGGAGAARGLGGRSRQTDTKRLSVRALALQLKIMNTKIICNLSAPPPPAPPAYKVSTAGCTDTLGCR